MQVGVDLKRMQTNFGGHDFSGFRDFAHFSFAFKRPKFFFRPWAIKKGTEPLQELLNKIRTEKE